MNAINTITQYIHKYFLPILLAAYVLAVVIPGPGLALRNLSIGQIAFPGSGGVNLSFSLIMLAFLLFNAGLGIKSKEIKHLVAQPLLTMLAFIANSAIPIVIIFLLRGAIGSWHNQDEVQNLLTGLAVIVAMPIAGSSTAWSQNANGNLSLSLGLVLLSTLLSPISTPFTLHAFSLLTTGDYSEDLQELAQQGTNVFMCLTVVVPSLAGIFLHFGFGEKKVADLKPILKLINFVFLLMLNYSNAAISLPQAICKPDIDFLVFIIIATSLMCMVGFGSGWALSKIFKTDKADMASLMFGLGMNNNGTGLVLAGLTLADHPSVFLPMIFYTLIQQVVAALVDSKFFQNQRS